MSLRMNLYGWSFQSFHDVLGSNEASVLKAATGHLEDTLKDESALARSKAWLRTLIEAGFPMRHERGPKPEPADGGLLTLQMETETHVCAVNSIVCAIRRDDFVDLSSESSDWAHPAVGSLYQDLSACGFWRSAHSSVELFTWMAKLNKGSPFFGDEFRTQWSFYTSFTNQELAAMVPVFQSAARFKRPIPKSYPAQAAKKLQTGLSTGGKEFIGDLVKWFGRVERSGQDAFILWS